MELTIAAWQTSSIPGDPDANLRRLAETARQASAAGADVLVTPEMFLTGYNIGASAIAELAQRDLTGEVADIARQAEIAIVAGLPVVADGQVYNACVFVAESGEVRAVHHKVHLFGDLDRAVFAAGSVPCTLVEHRGAQLAMMICYDVEFPEYVRSAAVAGAEVLLVPTANMQPFDIVPRTILPARAWENQLAIAYANHVGADGDLLYTGLSGIFGPDGEALMMAGRSESLLIATVDTAQVQADRKANPYLEDRRPDVYR
ncbi:carbon-nitrogen hydrolase family protein [Brevibacterium daeguense]|nr:carbon-nitrogen hydrolase family protein [Brevibacterium daeguense]